ncbi:MAG: hypothetical protein ACYCXK_09835 [Candidatus Humimicrobiaceae bacterium]
MTKISSSEKNYRMKKLLMIVSMAYIIAIAGTVTYYYVFFKPEQSRINARQEQNMKDKENVIYCPQCISSPRE